jgi:hypothetical protein
MENMPDINDRSKRPCVRITAIWGKDSYDTLPPKSVVEKAAKACSQLLAMLGFCEVAIGVGPLGGCITNAAQQDKDLLDRKSWDEKGITIDEEGKELPSKVSNSKISVEDMLKGIDITKTSEEK